MSTWAIILAAGSGSRLAKAGIGEKKQFLQWKTRPLYWHSVHTLSHIPRVFGLVLVLPEQELLQEQERIIELMGRDALGLPWLAVAGGPRRQDSVANGLAALPSDCESVLVHDAARPFTSPALCNALLDALLAPDSQAHGVIPGLPVNDTIKQVREERVLQTLTRGQLRAVQTPQAFRLRSLRQAHREAALQGWEVTDDASMLERMGLEVLIIPGEEANVKITTKKDLGLLQEQEPPVLETPVCGWGYDVHRYVAPDATKARPMKLGGVPIPGAPHVQAHSDGDVLLHALTDALLGCAGRGDIGERFPDSDPGLENMNSAVFLDLVLEDLLADGIRLRHVDCTVIAQIPRIAPHKQLIRDNLSKLLHLPVEWVNVKATTEEGLGFTGEKKGIKAVAMVMAVRRNDPAPGR